MDEFFKNFTSDQIRFYLASIAPETSDSDFIWQDFQNCANALLLGKLGNFVHRTLVFAKNKCGGIVPPAHDFDELDKTFLKDITLLVNQIDLAYEHFHLRKAASLIMELAQKGNTYFDAKKPWVLAKDSALHTAMKTTIALCLVCIKKLALVSLPIIPQTAQKIWEFLGYDTELAKEHWEEVQREPLPEGQKLKEPQVLFTKVESIPAS